ncbi:MAG: hypothetical protein ACRDJP_13335, partial [Actinomycetota bacterium]
ERAEREREGRSKGRTHSRDRAERGTEETVVPPETPDGPGRAEGAPHGRAEGHLKHGSPPHGDAEGHGEHADPPPH